MNFVRKFVLTIIVSTLSSLAEAATPCLADKLSAPDQNSIEDIEKLAWSGDSHAQALIGFTYLYGQGVKVNASKGLDLLGKSAAAGDSDGQFILARHTVINAKSDADFKLAAALFKKSASQGCAASKFYLGGLMKQGKGIKKDEEEGQHLMVEAAKDGYVPAQLWIGAQLITGDGTKRDTHEGLRWIKLAASTGDAAAQLVFASLLFDGSVIDSDPQAARKIYEDVYARGGPQAPSAAASLGWMYMEGKGVNVDYVKAYDWLSSAAQAGNPDGRKLLSSLIEKLTKKRLISKCPAYDSEESGNMSFEAAGGEEVAIFQDGTKGKLVRVLFPARQRLAFISQTCLF